jgi:hypothetical protein
MTDDAPSPSPPLRRASNEEVVEALSFALRFDGRRLFPQASSLMARITAEHLMKHLARCGFEVSKRPDRAAPTMSHHREAIPRREMPRSGIKDHPAAAAPPKPGEER